MICELAITSETQQEEHACQTLLWPVDLTVAVASRDVKANPDAWTPALELCAARPGGYPQIITKRDGPLVPLVLSPQMFAEDSFLLSGPLCHT